MLRARLGRAWTSLRTLALLLAVPLAWLPGTAARAEDGEVPSAALAQFIGRTHGKGREAGSWADDLLRALRELRFDRSPENVCAAAAIIGQESGFVANPVVPNIGKLAAEAASKKINDSYAHGAFFLGREPTKRAFIARLRASRTERDIDHAYRWLIKTTLDDFKIPYLIEATKATYLTTHVESRNEINTLGSMQVSIKFALREQTGKDISQLSLDETYRIRDSLYQRYEGMYFGIKQLLGYRADYDNKTSLFADYNAGRYSSRNAAIQWMAAKLSGRDLGMDGDLLSYADEAPKAAKGETELALLSILQAGRGWSEEALRADLLLEKTPHFNRTETFREIRRLYQVRFGTEPPYEMIPQITLKNLKIKRRMTTAIFAVSVDRRYRACLSALTPGDDVPRVSSQRPPVRIGAGRRSS